MNLKSHTIRVRNIQARKSLNPYKICLNPLHLFVNQMPNLHRVWAALRSSGFRSVRIIPFNLLKQRTMTLNSCKFYGEDEVECVSYECGCQRKRSEHFLCVCVVFFKCFLVVLFFLFVFCLFVCCFILTPRRDGSILDMS